jgi:hypothetical protein
LASSDADCAEDRQFEAFTEVQPGCVSSSENTLSGKADPVLIMGKATVVMNAKGKSNTTATESKTTRTVGNLPHGSRETPVTSETATVADRLEKAECHNSNMHVAGESDSPIVPEKLANNDGVPPSAESVEGRGLTEENIEQSLLVRIQRRNSDGTPFVPRSRGLLGVREAAQRDEISRCAVCTSTS